uniref:Uncharacterized protein n=1 Tax=Zea mays TaxID=4577 RepID=C4J1H2_MAIZE|nr:unknown [Zea mays]ACR36209.1 unknown [Zea mays]
MDWSTISRTDRGRGSSARRRCCSSTSISAAGSSPGSSISRTRLQHRTKNPRPYTTLFRLGGVDRSSSYQETPSAMRDATPWTGRRA